MGIAEVMLTRYHKCLCQLFNTVVGVDRLRHNGGTLFGKKKKKKPTIAYSHP
jgi:hypothetical protein